MTCCTYYNLDETILEELRANQIVKNYIGQHYISVPNVNEESVKEFITTISSYSKLKKELYEFKDSLRLFNHLEYLTKKEQIFHEFLGKDKNKVQDLLNGKDEESIETGLQSRLSDATKPLIDFYTKWDKV